MKTAFDTTWYVEQEGRIKAAAEEGARLRREMRQRFDPGHLYIVEFTSGVLKVGKSANPERRLEQHAKAGLVKHAWVSARHLGCSATERELLAYCADHGQLHGGREYFTGLKLSPVIIRATLIVLAAKDKERADYVATLVEAADGDLSATWQDAHQRAFGEDVTA